MLLFSTAIFSTGYKASLCFPPFIDNRDSQMRKSAVTAAAAASSPALRPRPRHCAPRESAFISCAADSKATALLANVSNTTRSGLQVPSEGTREAHGESANGVGQKGQAPKTEHFGRRARSEFAMGTKTGVLTALTLRSSAGLGARLP